MAPEAENTEGTGTEFTAEDIDLIASLDVDMSDDNGGGDKGDISDKEKGNNGSETASSDKKAKEDVVEDKTKDDSKEKKVEKGNNSEENTNWFDSIENKDLKELAEEYSTRDDFLKALGIESSQDWRASITDPKLREHADRFPSITDLVKGNMELKQQVSAALVLPNKNATKEERQAFATRLNSMLGVPKDASEYSFPKSPDGVKLSEEEQASRDNWSKFFLENHVPKRIGDSIIKKFTEEVEAGNALITKKDKEFAEKSETELRAEWGDDYETNHTLAARTAREFFGDDFEEMMQVSTSDGRLLMDSKPMLKALARFGREMNEGSVDLMTATERETLDDQIKDLRKRSAEAKDRGETRLANKLFADEQNLLTKIAGRRPIVGAGRNA